MSPNSTVIQFSSFYLLRQRGWTFRPPAGHASLPPTLTHPVSRDQLSSRTFKKLRLI